MKIEPILSALLPSPSQTLLLEACLHRGARAAQAWDTWCAGQRLYGRALKDALAETRTLLPLLARSVTRSEIALPTDVRSYLRAAAAREQLRGERFRTIAAGALSALAQEEVTAYAVRGAALAATVYPSWELRHCHDLDLLVPPAELGSAVRALVRAGCTAAGPHPRDGALLRHPAGLAVALHTQPFGMRYYETGVDSFAKGARTIAIGNAPTKIPSREANIVHVLGHATYSSSRLSLRWVADAWHLIAAENIDWPDVVARVQASRLAVPLSVLVRYLVRLGVHVSADAAAKIDTMAAGAPAAAEDVALGGALAAVSGDLRTLWRSADSWRGRVRLGKWMIVPSPEYVRTAFRIPAAPFLPLCYVWRPVRFVTGRVAQRMTRVLAKRGG